MKNLSYIIVKNKKLKHCQKCNKGLRSQNNSGLCYSCDNIINGAKRRKVWSKKNKIQKEKSLKKIKEFRL